MVPSVSGRHHPHGPPRNDGPDRRPHVGVKPDVAVPAAKAQQRACAEILRTLIAKASDAEVRQELNAILAGGETGEGQKAEYRLPR